MTPLRLSYIWYRRLYVALFAMSSSYVVIYALLAFNIQHIPEPVQVDLLSAIGGLLVAISSIVLFIMAKKVSTFWPAFITYAVFALTTAYLVQSTGGVSSSFLPLWALAVFIAPIFGAYGWLPVLVMTGSYIAGAYLTDGLATQTIVLIAMSSFLPLIAGLYVWRETPDSEDISTRNVKHLASQLSEVATKSEIVINAIGDGVIAIDGKGIIQLINPAAQEILGWGKQDALMLSYKSILKLVDANNREVQPAQDPLQEVLNTNQQARSNKLLAVTNSGKKIALSLVASPIGDPGSGAIAVFRDTTNERAEEREQAEFISTASHEMRTPVASIEGYLGLALNANTATVDARARDFINKAHEAAQHLGRLFQDLLDVSKSEDGRMTNTPRVVDIVPFTQSIVQGLTQKAGNKGLVLRFIPDHGNNNGQGIKKLMPVYYVNLDNDHIREILDNLIENAIKYTPEGEIQVDIAGSDDKVTISIKDSGLGIPTEDIPHLFQKFYRVSNMDRQSIGGTGLGLYLCRRLVEAMQGRLWVESVYGEGSTFFVELPRIDTQEAGRLKEEQDRLSIKPVPPKVEAPVAPAAGKSIPVTFEEALVAPTVIPIPAGTSVAPVAAPTAAQAPQVAPAPQPVAQAPVAVSSQAPDIPPPPASVMQPAAPLQPSSLPQPSAPPVQVQPVVSQSSATPATSVPRGETLTREQINERVRQLEALAQQQRSQTTPQDRQ